MPEVLAPCCLHLHTLAQFAPMRLVTDGMVMQKSMNPGTTDKECGIKILQVPESALFRRLTHPEVADR